MSCTHVIQSKMYPAAYALMEHGYLMMQNRRYDEAEVIFSEAITLLEKEDVNSERDGWLSQAHNNLGLVFYKKVEFQKAITNYSKSIEINASAAPAYYNRGTIFYRLGRYELAVKDMERAVSICSENSEFQTGLEESQIALRQNFTSVTV